MMKSTILAKLITLAINTREKQKEYFAGNKKVLGEAKSLETQLDKMLFDLNKSIAGVHIDTTIRLVNGKTIDLLYPQLSDIDIYAFAVGCSNCCRFAGQVKVFYSVLEHSMWVAKRAPVGYKLAALIHDLAEGVMHDISSPLKSALMDYKVYEDNMSKLIYLKCGIPHLFKSPIVKEIDTLAFEWECENVRDKMGVLEQPQFKILERWVQLFNYFSETQQ